MKPKTKRILKISIPIVGLCFFATSAISLSGVFINVETISIGGSSAVLPLITEFANTYKNADIITSAGGSGVGINSVIDGTKEIGISSRDPHILSLPENDEKYQAWKQKQIKTLTVAWDGIGIIYKSSSEEELVLNEENLAKIYCAFSGIKKIKLGDVLSNNNQNEIVPFARNGGSAISGTADGFWKNSNLNYKNSNFWKSLSETENKNIIEALEKGAYGSNVVQTAESNSQAWARIKNANEGAMIYLSAGFILKNKKEIEKLGFKIAKYKNFDLDETKLANGYNWYRPFNLMFSIKQIRKKEAIVKTIEWMLFDQQAQQIIRETGYIPLSEQQKKSMGYDGNNRLFFIEEKYQDTILSYSGAKNENK